jgi:hypothetical protein
MSEQTISGGCLCGLVKYEATGPAQFRVLCHCRDCQRASGTGRVPVMGVLKSGFRVTRKTKSYGVVGGSRRQAIRHFCPECGSLLFGTPEVIPHIVTLHIGNLDDPRMFHPTTALFTRYRLDWDQFADGLEAYDMTPPTP